NTATSEHSLTRVPSDLPALRNSSLVHFPTKNHDVREEMMRQQNGLRALGVRVAGHHRVDVFLRAGDQRRRQRRDRLEQPSASSPDIEPQVYGDLVIATPPRMELAAQWAALLLPSLLDRHVDVFRGRHPALTRGELFLEL